MKKILFFLIISFQVAYAQQKTIIKDSVLLNVLDTFIGELKLNEKKYKLIRVQLTSYNKQPVKASADTINAGVNKSVELTLPMEYDVSYSLELRYEINSRTIEWYPVTYYSLHRNIPILLSTGFEDLIEPDRSNKRALMKAIEKTSDPHAMAPVIIWIVDVYKGKVTIRKPADRR
jgi:hypothetical protein